MGRPHDRSGAGIGVYNTRIDIRVSATVSGRRKRIETFKVEPVLKTNEQSERLSEFVKFRFRRRDGISD